MNDNIRITISAEDQHISHLEREISSLENELALYRRRIQLVATQPDVAEAISCGNWREAYDLILQELDPDGAVICRVCEEYAGREFVRENLPDEAPGWGRFNALRLAMAKQVYRFDTYAVCSEHIHRVAVNELLGTGMNFLHRPILYRGKSCNTFDEFVKAAGTEVVVPRFIADMATIYVDNGMDPNKALDVCVKVVRDILGGHANHMAIRAEMAFDDAMERW